MDIVESGNMITGSAERNLDKATCQLLQHVRSSENFRCDKLTEIGITFLQKQNGETQVCTNLTHN